MKWRNQFRTEMIKKAIWKDISQCDRPSGRQMFENFHALEKETNNNNSNDNINNDINSADGVNKNKNTDSGDSKSTAVFVSDPTLFDDDDIDDISDVE